MHPHQDETATGPVVLVNYGRAVFFTDDAKHCMAQLTRQSWCVGNGAGADHWYVASPTPALLTARPRATAADCKNRWCHRPNVAHPIMECGERGNLLFNRLCGVCASGGRGTMCPSCEAHKVTLESGDVIIFNGRTVVHGVERVLPDPTPLPLPEEETLEPWARSLLETGFRVSLQWRQANRATIAKRQQAAHLKECRLQKDGRDHQEAWGTQSPDDGFSGEDHHP